MFKTLHGSVAPLIQQKYSNKVRVIFRQHIQPWHPSSTLTHEVGAAVLQLEPSKFWDFSLALFEHQKEYFDVNVVNEARNQTYGRLARLAKESVGLDEEKVLELLRVSDKPGPDGSLNVGNQVTNDVKKMVRAARVVGAHVSPTVFFDGIEEGSIGSSFTKEQWEEWLEKNAT